MAVQTQSLISAMMALSTTTLMVRDNMPTITATSAFESSSSLNSSYNGTFTAGVPQGVNPYIYIETLPSELVFIVVGASLGVLLVGLFSARLHTWVKSNRAARNASKLPDSNTPYYDPGVITKKMSPSVYSLGSGSTLAVSTLAPPGSRSSVDMLIPDQGRSYRSTAASHSRASLFVSPTQLLTGLQPTYLNCDNSPIESPQSLSFDLDKERSKTPRRPPSVYMDQMFDDDLESYESGADEKV